MLVEFEYNGVGEISGAKLIKSELLVFLDSNVFLRNPEVWRTLTVSFTNDRSNQKLVINFRIDNHELEEFDGVFQIKPESRGSEYFFDALYVYDRANGSRRITKSEISQDLNLEFGFLLKESGAKIKLSEDDSLAYR